MLESGIGVCKNEGRLPLRNIERGKEIAEEYGFLGSFGHGEIFSFHAREGDGIGLFAGGPDNASAVVIEDEARRQASIIGISCAGGIDIAMERSEREILEIGE